MPIVLAGRRGDQTKSLANDSFQLRRRLELRRASARDVHRLPRAWVLALPRLPSTDGKGSKSNEGDGLAALERGADRCKHCAERAVGGSLGPAALRGHGGDQIRAGHAKRCDVVMSSGRMLAEAPESVKAAAIPTESRWWYGGRIVKKVMLFTMEGIADGEAALAFFQSRGAAVEVRD